MLIKVLLKSTATTAALLIPCDGQSMLKRPLIAIDIGSSAVKVVEVAGHGDRRLKAIGLETLPPGAVVDGLIEDPEAVSLTLKDLLKRLKIRPTGRRAALALSGSSVLIRKVSMEVSKDSELAEQIFYEAEQHFQVDMADIFFDYAELGHDPIERATSVVLAGARREIVERYLATVRSVGLRTGVIECSVFSSANMFEHNYGQSEGLVAIVNVGATTTQVSLIMGGRYAYTRDIPFGGRDFTNKVAESLGVELANAESLKLAAAAQSDAVPDELHSILGSLNEQLVSEIQVTIDYFFQSGDPVAQTAGGLSGLYLVGGASRSIGLDATLAAALSIPVQIVNPFQRIEVNTKRFEMDYLMMQGHLYGVAVGLGLRGFKDTA